jgi:hypothetical protein
MRVDPDNRLVADTLEAQWNETLRALEQARQDCEKQRAADRASLDDVQRGRILALAHDFPAIWNDPATPQRERKRMAALLIEDITLIKGEHVTAHVRFRGGATTTLTLPRPLLQWQARQTPAAVMTQLDALLEDHTDADAAKILDERGARTGAGEPFSSEAVKWLCRRWGLKSLKQRLRAKGMMTISEVARQLGVSHATVKKLRADGRLRGRRCNDLGECVYEPPAEQLVASRGSRQHGGRARRRGPCDASAARGAV